MADQNKSQDDLSIEEILGSIRRIIAEDEDDTPAPIVENDILQASAVDETEDEEEEPLELTNKIEQDGSIIDTAEPEIEPEIAYEPAPSVQENYEPEPEIVEDDFVMQDSNEEPKYQEKIILVEEPVPMAQEENLNDALLSSTNAAATSAVMAKLARHTALLEETAFSGGTSGPSIESIVREMLKPLLKSWLDENLPDMVQKMVEREIERLTKHL